MEDSNYCRRPKASLEEKQSFFSRTGHQDNRGSSEWPKFLDFIELKMRIWLLQNLDMPGMSRWKSVFPDTRWTINCEAFYILSALKLRQTSKMRSMRGKMRLSPVRSTPLAASGSTPASDHYGRERPGRLPLKSGSRGGNGETLHRFHRNIARRPCSSIVMRSIWGRWHTMLVRSPGLRANLFVRQGWRTVEIQDSSSLKKYYGVRFTGYRRCRCLRYWGLYEN